MSVSGQNRYVLITPVKDEEKYIEATLRSVAAQTLKPCRWIILDDGSSDATPEILRRYAEKYEWIQVVRIERDANRLPGSAEIRAFVRGYEIIKDDEFDFVVKLDGDLELPPHYFEYLCDQFNADESLGLASGHYLEHRKGRWNPIPMPEYHVAGASKMYRKKCYTDIGGLEFSRAWDTVDEIRAWERGWTTRHFDELEFYHLKIEGSGVGQFRTNIMCGEVYYLSGGGIGFFLLKLLYRVQRSSPFLLGSLSVLWGYLKCCISRRPKAVSESEARRYRQMQRRIMLDGISTIFCWPLKSKKTRGNRYVWDMRNF